MIRLPRRRGEHHHAAVLALAKDFLRRALHLVRFGEADALLRRLRLRAGSRWPGSARRRRLRDTAPSRTTSVQRVADIVESAGRRIERQHVLQVRIHAEQVAHGVFVFRRGSAAATPHAPRSARRFAAASSSRAVMCRTTAAACAGSGCGSFFGGISPDCDARRDLMPALEIFPLGKIRHDLIEPQIALRRLRSVTSDAVLLEEHRELRFHLRLRFRRAGGNDHRETEAHDWNQFARRDHAEGDGKRIPRGPDVQGAPIRLADKMGRLR